jgi:hypothetical protein
MATTVQKTACQTTAWQTTACQPQGQVYSAVIDTKPSKPSPRKDTYQSNLALLKVPPSIVVDKHQTQVIPCRKLLIDIFERRRKIKSAQEQSNWDRFPTNRGSIHDFEFGNGIGFVVLIGCCAGCLAADDGEFHVFYFETDKEEVDFADDDVL